MKIRRLIYFIILVITLLPLRSFSQLFTIGPVLNWNFCDKQCKFSWGIELGIHGFLIGEENGIGSFLSLDIALENEKPKTRFYTELQYIGIIPAKYMPVFYGLSAGPVVEWGKETKTSVGFQATAWSCYYLGASFRYRWMKAKNYFGPGVFFKLPIAAIGEVKQ